MLNLLQYEQKKKIVREYRTRFVIVALGLFLAIEIIASVLLIPSYAISVARIDSLTEQAEQYNAEQATGESIKLNNLLKESNQMIGTLAATSTPKNTTDALIKLLDTRTLAIHIDGIIYQAEKGSRHFVLQGRAVSREDLLNFTKKLRELPKVTKVDLPVSNFAQSEDINFSVTIIQTL